MPNRFKQSAPPSLEKIYQGLPVGPWGVPPYIHRHGERSAVLWIGKVSLWIRQGLRRVIELLSARRMSLDARSTRIVDPACCSTA